LDALKAAKIEDNHVNLTEKCVIAKYCADLRSDLYDCTMDAPQTHSLKE
jgi:hypothetical protein